MSSTPFESSPPLSAVERHVLMLLARSIPRSRSRRRFNLSAYAVKVRLREARRKTGAARSRELVRRLAAQENWYKQIEVPGDDPHSREPEVARRGHGGPPAIEEFRYYARHCHHLRSFRRGHANPRPRPAQTGRILTGVWRFAQHGLA